MKAIVNKGGWQETFKGFEITDCAIRQSNLIYFCAKKKLSAEEESSLSDSQIPSRIIAINTERDEDDNWGFQEIEGMNYPVIGVSRAPFPRPSGLLTSNDGDGDTWAMGGGSNGPMEQIAPGKWPGTNRLKCINGFTYSVSGCRDIYKRVAVGQWIPFTKGFPTEAEQPDFSRMASDKMLDITSGYGFNDLDAFSESDMYAVGGHGDVWHFDGREWSQMGFPSNVQLGTVTCAGDGNVYISGEGGSLWVGRESTWKLIYKGGSSILWNDVLWFDDKLWLASDYQLRIWNGKALESVTHEGRRVPICGNMDAHDGILVVASLECVMSFDGHEWRTIVAPYFD